MNIYGPKNNFSKFENNLDVEIFSITSVTSPKYGGAIDKLARVVPPKMATKQ